MDEHSNLEKFREAGRVEPGNAQKAWNLLVEGIDTASCPEWVKAYVRKSAQIVAAYDLDNGDQAMLAHHLGFYKEPSKRLSKAVYDRDHVFEWFVDRMTRDAKHGLRIVIERTAREYHEEYMKGVGEPGSIKKAYEQARKAFNARMADELTLQALLADREDAPQL